MFGRPQKSVSMRSSLLWSVTGAMVALALALLIAAAVDNRISIRQLSGALITQSLERAERDVRVFFEPATRTAYLLASWGQDGILTLDELTDENGQPSAQFHRWNLALSSLLESAPQVSGLAILDDRGSEYSIVANADGWLIRVVRSEDKPDPVRYYQWTSISEGPVAALDRSSQFDVHARPWFQPTIDAFHQAEENHEPMEPRWTAPYLSNTTGKAAITVSIAARGPDGLVRVVAVYTSLEQLSRFTMAHRLRTSGLVLVATEEPLGEGDDTGTRMFVVGLPAGVELEDGEHWRSLIGRPFAELGIQTLVDAVSAYDAVVARDPSIEERNRYSLKYRSQGETWWGALEDLRLDSDTRLWMLVLVPESDLLFGADEVGWGLAATLLLIFALGVRRAARLAGFISTPLEHLAHESERISRGDLEPGDVLQSPVKEIQSLAEAQDRMRDGLKSLMKLEGDLQLARQIQQRTLPQDIPEVDGFEIAGWSEPAEETAGDTWDVIERDDGHVWLILADATGHGVGPALSVVQARAMIRAISHLGTSLSEAVNQVNQQLCADLPPGRFITLWFGELDPGSRTLTSFSAGQAPLFHYRAASDEFKSVEADTYPFGIDPGPIEKEPRIIQMDKGDMFIVISDGIFEAEAPDGEQMGTERVLDALRTERKHDLDGVLTALRATVESFTRGQPARDDQTIVLLRAR